MKYSQEIKEKVISDYNSGIKASIISKNTNISKSTIYQWLNEKQSTTPLPISHRESQKLVRKVQRLETMLEIIQNTDFFKQIPLKEKLKIADNLYEQYGINVTCDALGMLMKLFTIIKNVAKETIGCMKKEKWNLNRKYD